MCDTPAPVPSDRNRRPPSFNYDWTTTRLYELDSLWWGQCIGGRHYTGHVSWTDPTKEGRERYCRHELERRLSLREARELFPDRSEGYWGRTQDRSTNRFDTKEQLERAAATWVRDTHAVGVPNWILLEDGGALNPARPIAAAGWFTDRVGAMEAVATLWDGVPNGVRMSKLPKDVELWNFIYGRWYELLTPPTLSSS